jgi:hypothetical protein
VFSRTRRIIRVGGDRSSHDYDRSYDPRIAASRIHLCAEAGGVALWTKADSVTRFDRLIITPLP